MPLRVWWWRRRRSQRDISGDLLYRRSSIGSRGSIGASITFQRGYCLGAHLNYELHICIFILIMKNQCCYNTIICVNILCALVYNSENKIVKNHNSFYFNY